MTTQYEIGIQFIAISNASRYVISKEMTSRCFGLKIQILKSEYVKMNFHWAMQKNRYVKLLGFIQFGKQEKKKIHLDNAINLFP